MLHIVVVEVVAVAVVLMDTLESMSDRTDHVVDTVLAVELNIVHMLVVVRTTVVPLDR